MKELYLGVVFFSFIVGVTAQTIVSVSPGTDLYIPAGTTFTSGKLSLVPSSDFTINGLNIERNGTVTNTLSTVYVSDVYRFSSNSNPFNGVIRFAYDDADLNGLTESALAMAAHDGSSWQVVSADSYDADDNYIITSAISNKPLVEFAIVDAFAVLPLQWGPVSAWRLGTSLKIEWHTKQEQYVSHFTVERSSDGRNWSTAVSSVPARNLPTTQQYSVTDPEYTSGRVYYRILQSDLDGKHSYSAVVAVAAEKETGMVLVYPNPVRHSFTIRAGQTGNNIRLLQLFSSHGELLRAWTTYQQEYRISDLPGGVYHLRIQTDDNQIHSLKITKP